MYDTYLLTYLLTVVKHNGSDLAKSLACDGIFSDYSMTVFKNRSKFDEVVTKSRPNEVCFYGPPCIGYICLLHSLAVVVAIE